MRSKIRAYQKWIVAVAVFLLGHPAVNALPTQDELEGMKQWTEKSFLSNGALVPATSGAPIPSLRVLQQDYGNLEINRSVIKTPLHIGKKDFAHGLGINSVSEIEVMLPQGAQRFDAQVGVDNNSDTAGSRGSVEFVVEGGGKQLFKSNILRGGDGPLPVSVNITGSATMLLQVTDGGDGPQFDQGDWAEGVLRFANGEKIRLDELPVVTDPQIPRGPNAIPFSFRYGEKTSDELLRIWPRTVSDISTASSGKKIRDIVWNDPAGGLEVRCELTQFDDAPATDWMVRLTNLGKQPSSLIQDFNATNVELPLRNPIVRASNGSTAGPTDFVPSDEEMTEQGAEFKAVNGRSSQATLPFFNIFDRQGNGGYMLGLGWSGQWKALFRKLSDDAKTQEVLLSAGQENLRVRLKPGESIRSPRILLLHYSGPDPMRGHNLLRQTLLTHYVPYIEGKPAVPPIAAMTWFTYNNGSGVTETNQLRAIATMAPLGIEDFWIDAGWYGTGDWNNSVGSWDARKDVFPHGLKPLGDASHTAGMKMVVWFEPERVQKNTSIADQHPNFVHGGTNGGLFKLDEPDARKWMTQLLNDHIQKDGIDVLRLDYNIEPLGFWQGADEPDGHGMTENQYMQGLYAMWDELRADNPDLLIDDCASGGRRIDLETISRSIPLWRTDYAGDGSHPASDQAETAGLSLWVPLNSAGLWAFDHYTARSVATTGAAICCDLRDNKFTPQDIHRAIAEIKDLRELWLGDFYPLTPIGVDQAAWMAWQFDRPDLGRGFVMVFRRANVAQSFFNASLKALDSDSKYEVRLIDEGKTLQMTGKQLAAFQVSAPIAPSSVLILYRKLTK